MRRTAVAAALLASARSVFGTTITDDASVAASKSFDYIIAGGGLTGLVVGNKLSGAGYSVLIVEAGPNSQFVDAINVATARSGITAAQCNWKYDALADDGSKLSWQIDSGRCLGGSSSINGMVWYHPTQPEIDTLKSLGNKGWDWNSLYPYMKAVENNHLPTNEQRNEGANVDKDLHGFSGPVNVSFPDPMRIPDAQRLYKAAIPLVFNGVQLTDDLSHRTNTALGSTSWTVWNDKSSGTNVVRRSSAAHAFLYAQNQQRSKLTVLYNHKALKVNFDSNIKATGLQFGPSAGGSIYTATAKKEVLLAAGSLQTPPILERSGVGEEAILEKFGIDTLVDLPAVGRNLQDQPGTGASALVNDANATNTALIDGINLFAPVISLVNIDQIFGSNSSSQASALSSSLSAKAQAAVDAGAMASTKSAQALFKAQASLVLNNKMPIAEVVGESYPGVMTSVFWPLLPFSRGHVHIASSDPFAAPAITPRLLTDDFDVKVAVTIAKKAQSMFTTEPFSPIISSAYVDVPAGASDADWEAWYRETAYAASHWLGSSAMLPREYGGVVNNKLQVYGTKNLRVIDASILPIQVTAHTMTTAYAIAQKAADIILGKDTSVN
ncbi:alcohol oxidase [Schizophyllum commune Tattone D]|nr:alcohol oxidase [Schizophyllum commune Tattone D]